MSKGKKISVSAKQQGEAMGFLRKKKPGIGMRPGGYTEISKITPFEFGRILRNLPDDYSNELRRNVSMIEGHKKLAEAVEVLHRKYRGINIDIDPHQPGDYVIVRKGGYQYAIPGTMVATATVAEMVYRIERHLRLYEKPPVEEFRFEEGWKIENQYEDKKPKKSSTESWADKWAKENGLQEV